MEAITNLNVLIKEMKPSLQKDEYVFCSFTPEQFKDKVNIAAMLKGDVISFIAENKSFFCVLEKNYARAQGVRSDQDIAMKWITLTVNSSLQAFGLTAAFTKALEKEKIKDFWVNAATAHDHIFVPAADANKAMQALKDLSASVNTEASNSKAPVLSPEAAKILPATTKIVLDKKVYVFCSLTAEQFEEKMNMADMLAGKVRSFMIEEDMSLVLPEEYAREKGIKYESDSKMNLIELSVGPLKFPTASVAQLLGDNQVSCNLVQVNNNNLIFVPEGAQEKARNLLQAGIQ